MCLFLGTNHLLAPIDVKPVEKAAAIQIKPIRKKKITRKKESAKQAKPVSAYAHFFREKQILIKRSNPEVSFGEVSKIVASEWDSLSKEAKAVYKRKAHLEKSEYLKQLATFKANAVAGQLEIESIMINSNQNELVNKNKDSIKKEQQVDINCWSAPSLQPTEDWNVSSLPITITNCEPNAIHTNQLQNTHLYQPAIISVDYNYNQPNHDYSTNQASFDCGKNFANYPFK